MATLASNRQLFSHSHQQFNLWVRGGDSHIKQIGMLIVQIARSCLGLHEKKKGKQNFTLNLVFWVSLRCHKSLSHIQIGLLEGFNSKFSNSISSSLLYEPPSPPRQFNDPPLIGIGNLKHCSIFL